VKYLSVAAIVKNEAPYIEEWICFHLLQGAEHFYIYDNDSTDNTYSILERYKEAGIVTLEKLPGSAQQFPMIEKALKDHGHKTRWMAFIDCDEFLHAESPLPQFLKEFESYSALAVHWFLYGSKQQVSKYDLVINKFSFRGPVNKHVKSIVQPSKTISRGKDSHTFYLKTPAVNENKIELPKNYAIKSHPSAARIRINHYHVKSYEEFLKRKSLPRVSTGTYIKDIGESFRHHDLNEYYDPFTYQVIEDVKNLIEKYR